jgi:hypothetical protein
LSQVIIFGLYRSLGWTGLIASFAVVIAAAMMMVYLRSPGRPFVAALVTVWGAVASAPSWGVRPQMFSLLLASLFLLLLEKSLARPRLLWWTVPLTALWVNLHAGYALGIALLLISLLGSWLDAKMGVPQAPHSSAWTRQLGLACLLCLAVVPLNPNGIHLFSYPFETLSSGAMNRYIAEWASPDFHQPRFLPFAGMLLAILAVIPFSSRRIRPSDLLLLLVFSFAALRSMRHIPLFTLVAVPILSAQLENWWSAHHAHAGRAAPTRARQMMNLALLAAFAIFTVVRVGTVSARQPASETKNFPAGAVRYLDSGSVPTPILNHYNWGGYFVWKLYPKYRVFIDGRADLYGDAFMNEFADLYYLKDGWQSALDRWQIRTVVLPPDAPLITALRQSPLWKQVYADSQAVILVRPYAGSAR